MDQRKRIAVYRREREINIIAVDPVSTDMVPGNTH